MCRHNAGNHGFLLTLNRFATMTDAWDVGRFAFYRRLIDRLNILRIPIGVELFDSFGRSFSPTWRLTA
jgi:hypothetical protein